MRNYGRGAYGAKVYSGLNPVEVDSTSGVIVASMGVVNARRALKGSSAIVVASQAALFKLTGLASASLVGVYDDSQFDRARQFGHGGAVTVTSTASAKFLAVFYAVSTSEIVVAGDAAVDRVTQMLLDSSSAVVVSSRATVGVVEQFEASGVVLVSSTADLFAGPLWTDLVAIGSWSPIPAADVTWTNRPADFSGWTNG